MVAPAWAGGGWAMGMAAGGFCAQLAAEAGGTKKGLGPIRAET